MRTIFKYTSRLIELETLSPDKAKDQQKLLAWPDILPHANPGQIPFIHKSLDNPTRFMRIRHHDFLFGPLPDPKPALESLVGLYTDEIDPGGAAVVILSVIRDAHDRPVYNYYFFTNLPPDGFPAQTAELIKMLFTTSATVVNMSTEGQAHTQGQAPAETSKPAAHEFHIVLMLNNNDVKSSDPNNSVIKARIDALIIPLTKAFGEPEEQQPGVAGDKILNFFVCDGAWNTFGVVLQNNGNVPIGSFGHLSLTQKLFVNPYFSRPIERRIPPANPVKEQDKLYLFTGKVPLGNTGQIPFLPAAVDDPSRFMRIKNDDFLLGPIPNVTPENFAGVYAADVATGGAALLVLPLIKDPAHTKDFYNSYFFANLPPAGLSPEMLGCINMLPIRPALATQAPVVDQFHIVIMLNNDDIKNDDLNDNTIKSRANAWVNAVMQAFDPAATVHFFVWDAAWSNFAVVLQEIEKIPIGSFGHLSTAKEIATETHQVSTFSFFPDGSNEPKMDYEEDPTFQPYGPDEQMVRGFGYPVVTIDVGIRYLPAATNPNTKFLYEFLVRNAKIPDIRTYKSLLPKYYQQHPDQYLAGNLDFIMTVTRPFQQAAGFPFVLPGKRTNTLVEWNVKHGIGVFIAFKNDQGYSEHAASAFLAYDEDINSITEFQINIDPALSSAHEKQILIVCCDKYKNHLDNVVDDITHCLGQNVLNTKIFCWITSDEDFGSNIQITVSPNKIEFGCNPTFWSDCILNLGKENQTFRQLLIPSTPKLGLISCDNKVQQVTYTIEFGKNALEIVKKIKQENDKESGLFSMITNGWTEPYMKLKTLSALLNNESILIVIVQRPAFDTAVRHRIVIYHTTSELMFKSSAVQNAIQRSVKVPELCQVLLVKLQSKDTNADTQLLTAVFNSMNTFLSPQKKAIGIANAAFCLTLVPYFSIAMGRFVSANRLFKVGIGCPETHDLYFGNFLQFDESKFKSEDPACVLQ